MDEPARTNAICARHRELADAWEVTEGESTGQAKARAKRLKKEHRDAADEKEAALP